MKKQQIEKEYGFAKLGERYFKEKVVDGKLVLEEITKKTADKKIKLLREIADKLKGNLDKEAVLMEALCHLEDDYLDMLHNSLYNSKRKIKPVTRRHHCVDMKVGKLIIPIVQ